MVDSSRAYRWLLAASLSALLAACNAQPAPLVARAGTTISLLVGSDLLDGEQIGYGTPLFQSLGIPEDQRGLLQIELGTTPPTLLLPKVITRVRPDPATQFAIDPAGSTLGGFGALMGMSQVVAIANIPGDTPAGTWPITLRRVDGAGQPLGTPLPYSHDITILASTGGAEDFNPLNAFAQAGSSDAEITGDIASLYPWPKLGLGVDPAAAAALHLEMSYPASRIQGILGVYDELDPAQGSIIQWHDDGAGTLSLDVVNPTERAFSLAVVFQPQAGEVFDPETDFAVLASTAYDVDGNPISPTVSFGAIR